MAGGDGTLGYTKFLYVRVRPDDDGVGAHMRTVGSMVARIAALHRRLYHNPNGYRRDGEFDFLTCFECEEQHACTFEDVLRDLRDTTRNPEWRFVEEGPLWRGHRVLRW